MKYLRLTTSRSKESEAQLPCSFSHVSLPEGAKTDNMFIAVIRSLLSSIHFLVLHLLNSSINVLKWSFLNTCVPTFISWQAQSPCRVVSLTVVRSQSPKKFTLYSSPKSVAAREAPTIWATIIRAVTKSQGSPDWRRFSAWTKIRISNKELRRKKNSNEEKN